MGEVGITELSMFQQGMTDQQKMLFLIQYGAEKKDRTMALVLSLLFGAIGVDRFYVGDIGLGILKLLTLGMFGIMVLIDLFLIMGRVDKFNRAKAQEIATSIKCNQCGEFLDGSNRLVASDQQIPWYFRTSTIVIAICCVGPLALPMIWFRPRLALAWKIGLTIAILVLSWALYAATLKSVNVMMQQYDELMGTY